MSQAVKCQYTCLVCKHKDLNKIENQLDKDFYNICDWFVDNKLSIHFDKDKTKSVTFASKLKRKNAKKLYIKYGDIQIKQHSDVKYLGRLLNETMSGETMALIVVSKINNNLKFFSRKNSFLTPAMRYLVCNVLVPPHFSYVCSVWYPNLREKLKHRTQTT